MVIGTALALAIGVGEVAGNGPCTTDADCDDGNPCTADVCENLECHNDIQAGLFCDGGLCDAEGNCVSCDGFLCLDGNDCDDDNPCTRDVCVQSTNQCCNLPHSGLPCDDGNPCTHTDICDAGICAGTSYDCDDGNECTEDICGGIGGCHYPPYPSGLPCGDPSDTECDNPDSCDGGGTCQDNYEALGTACGNGICDGEGDCGQISVGGTVEPTELTEQGSASSEQSGDNSTTSIALWAGLGSGLAIVGGFLVLRRRRVN